MDKKIQCRLKYENQTTDDISVFDNYDACFEEEKLNSKNKIKHNMHFKSDVGSAPATV